MSNIKRCSSRVWKRNADTDLNKYSHGRNIMGIFRPGVDVQPMIFESSLENHM